MAVDVEAIHIYRRLVDNLLDRAEEARPDKHIEPPLTEAHLGDSIWLVQGDDEQAVKRLSQQTQFAAVEIAFREKFYSILATTSIDEPAFIQIWRLLDIISIFSDNEQCEPGLIFWLIEELLDSQTINGCRKVFDYLESRRERNTKSFPLGDKSAVNLRGEYHTENVTTFDEIARSAAKENGEMDVDTSDEKEASTTAEGQKSNNDSQTSASGDSQSNSQETTKTPKVVVSRGDDQKGKKPVDLDALYPMFWGLQAYFSAPTKVFDPQHFASFKSGLEATLSSFRNINTDLDNQSTSRASEDLRKSNKRKRTADGPEIASSFNPKYLTSRDLFDLEVNDTAFRRHVLVQALILLDFMLSLTPKAKARLADLTNKSVLYGFVLNEDDTKWATKTRKAIEEYLQEGTGGKFYYRMVDTVLSRDKNWVRWKAEGCPLIERPPISVAEYIGARDHATKAYANKRLRSSPMGSLNLNFLSEGESLASLERLKEPERFSVPAADSFMMGIMDDELDIDMAQTKEEKEDATRAKASKTWRILRLSSRSKLAAFEKIEDGKNLKILFETPQAPEGTPQAAEGTPKVVEGTAAKPSSTEGDKTVTNGTEQESSGIEKESAMGTEQDSAESKRQEAGPTDNQAT
ncbi:THO complex subunit 1 [Aspergillus wentii]|nr:THO complex subunit 1 [Aspergillus wentii]